MRIKSTVRYELKYLISWQQRDALQAELLTHMAPDSHGDSLGQYTITSLYHDTADHRAYWDKIEGERFRRKVRVRVYGDKVVTPETMAFLEIKQRQNKTLTKKRVQLPYASAIDRDKLALLEPSDNYSTKSIDVVNEVMYLYHTLHLQPTCIVRYNRLAFNGNELHPDLRVTFDTELKCRTHDLTLLSTGLAEDHYFLPPQICIMELKANQTIPYWLAQIINKYGCRPRRVSKYCASLEQSGILLQNQKIII